MSVIWPSRRRPSGPLHVASTVVVPPAVEPLTRAQGKLRAGLDWVDGDPRDALMDGFIAAARAKVEQDTGYALLLQTRDLFFDASPGFAGPFELGVRPIKSVTSFQYTSLDGALTAITGYVLDTASARIGLGTGAAWPSDARSFQPYVIRVVVGYDDVATLLQHEPLLVHAVGLLTAHYATLGRDLASVDQASEVPQGYTDALSTYLPVTVA